MRAGGLIPRVGEEMHEAFRLNLMLGLLDDDVLSLLEPHTRSAHLSFGDRLAEAGETIDKVYFPTSGIVSFVVELTDGVMIEAGMSGRDGAVNAGPSLDGKVASYTALVQGGGQAWVIEADRFKAIAEQSPALSRLIMAQELLIQAQGQQSAACNASHIVEARMCRWLLRMRDLADSENLKITQEFLAHMLGVQRASVSLVASELQRKGIIRYSRGSIRILDLQAMHHASCECYEAVKSHYSRMYGSKALGLSHAQHLAHARAELVD
jgi:CRP-like cAMP-binding protein